MASFPLRVWFDLEDSVAIHFLSFVNMDAYGLFWPFRTLYRPRGLLTSWARTDMFGGNFTGLCRSDANGGIIGAILRKYII